jgi:hypothetical protein
LKPLYGKRVYDRFIETNPFVRRWFPNFDPERHRSAYVEIETSRLKRTFEMLLRLGPAQLLEFMSRPVLRSYLVRKIKSDSDVQLDPRRLKLHFHSHKQPALCALSRSFTPTTK